MWVMCVHADVSAFTFVSHCVYFQKTVVSVRQRPDFPVTGQWEIETEEKPGQRETHVFDAVIVGSGHFTKPHLPLHDFPGTLSRTKWPSNMH